MSGHSEHPGINRLPPREEAKLARMLSRLASPFEDERATAGLMVSAFVARRDMKWSDLTTLLQPAGTPAEPVESVRQKDRRGSGAKAWLGYCRRRRGAAGQTLNVLT